MGTAIVSEVAGKGIYCVALLDFISDCLTLVVWDITQFPSNGNLV